MCVRDADDRCVLQFTLRNAAGCALHRRASRVIRRSELCGRADLPRCRAGRTRVRRAPRRSVLRYEFGSLGSAWGVRPDLNATRATCAWRRSGRPELDAGLPRATSARGITGRRPERARRPETRPRRAAPVAGVGARAAPLARSGAAGRSCTAPRRATPSRRRPTRPLAGARRTGAACASHWVSLSLSLSPCSRGAGGGLSRRPAPATGARGSAAASPVTRGGGRTRLATRRPTPDCQ